MNKQVILSFLVILVSCSGEVIEPCCSCNRIERPDDAYNYPIKPGMPEWEELSASEMLTVCQLPDTILISISSDGLLHSCLELPIFSQIIAAQSLQQGTDYFMQNFNGMVELQSRTEVGKFVSTLYKLMEVSCYDTLPMDNSGSRGNYTFRFTYIEMLMAQASMLNTMDDVTIQLPN